MRVKATRTGEYANGLIEAGQIFNLVPRKGKRQVHTRSEKTGEIIGTKTEDYVMTPEMQFSDMWMVKMKTSAKTTVALERVGKDELAIAGKTLTLPVEKSFHNGKIFGNELKRTGEESQDNMESGSDEDLNPGFDDESTDESDELGTEEEVTEENTAPDANNSGENVL